MTQHSTKEWLRAVARHLNISPSSLAVRAGMAASTLTRYLNDGSGTIGITQRSLEAVAEFSGVPLHVMPGQRKPGGFNEPDAVPIAADPAALPAWARLAIDELRAGSNAVDPWIMKSWALDLAGVMPGDVMVVDMNKRPKAGDIVCAQLVDWATGSAETVFRRFEPPFLMAHSAKMGAIKPEVVDEDRVSVRGVVVARLGIRN